ncbi:hypothetical protein BPODLACK_01091 [Gordonia sp. YY1]|nr:hypothetical protein BPODLACK_01091 [Gordonia sp. YY1]
MSSNPTSATAALACAAIGEIVTSIAAPESRSCLAISGAVKSALIVVAVAPARRMPWNTVANAGMFGDRMPTTSPTPIPRDASQPATASIWVMSSPYDVTAPDFGSTSAVRSSSSSAMEPNRNSWTLTSGISTSGNGLAKLTSTGESVDQ